MKNRINCLLLTGVLSLAYFATKAQGNPGDISAFLNAPAADANKLINAYVSPAIKAFSYGMTNGWANTAQNHKLGGFDLGVSVSAVMMPTAEETFDPTKLGLSTNTHPNTNIAPTLIGPKISSSYNFVNNGVAINNVNGPEGLDLKKNLGSNAVPVPILQAGIGLPLHTDLKIRYVPEQKSGDSKLKMLGFGLMHDIKQYIPGIKSVPFDLAVLAAYNSISGSTSLVNTSTDPVTTHPNQTDGVPYSTDGQSNYTLNSWVIQALISKKVSILTFYGGVGYGSVSTKATITGSFILDNPLFPNPSVNPNPVKLTNPFSTNYTNTGMKLTAGIRFKLGPLYLNTDYTLQQFSSVTAGLGLAIR